LKCYKGIIKSIDAAKLERMVAYGRENPHRFD
jgi:hypothetical protein